LYAYGDSYEGEFENSERNGEGVMIFSNGAKAKGQWKNGKLNGKATMWYANEDKDIYEGEWVDNIKCG
jgi:hypothetical protein